MLMEQGTENAESGQARPVKVICVTSGKGGVGKTNTTVNLALAAAKRGRKVMLLDADLGLANVCVLLGLDARHNLAHVMDGKKPLSEVIVEGPMGLRIVPGSSGIRRMAELSAPERAGMIAAFGSLTPQPDILFVDSASGISDTVLSFARASTEVVVVLCDEPTALTDAYAVIKVLSREYGVRRFQVVANRTLEPAQGRTLFSKLAAVCDRFLDVALGYLGSVPDDSCVARSVQMQRAVLDAFPSSKSAVAFRRIAEQLERTPMPVSTTGHLQFFLEQSLGNPLVQGAVNA